MIAEFINSSLEYLLGDTDSAGRLRRSELVEGNLPSLLEARKMAAKYTHPHITVSYREPKPLERIGGYGFEERLKEDILETFLQSENSAGGGFLLSYSGESESRGLFSLCLQCATLHRQQIVARRKPLSRKRRLRTLCLWYSANPAPLCWLSDSE